MKCLLLLSSMLLITTPAAQGMDCLRALKNKLSSCCNQAQPVAPAPVVIAVAPAPVVNIGLRLEEREQLADDVATYYPVEYQLASLELLTASKRYPQAQ